MTEDTFMLSKLGNNPNYVFDSGIYRQKSVYSPTQEQTGKCFGFKWEKRDTYESNAMESASRKWLLERYVLPDTSLDNLIKGKCILDAGCGSGYSASLLFAELLNCSRYLGVDISSAVDVAKERFTERGLRGDFLQANILDLPEEIGNFDIVFSEGVLHHTDSTERAIKYLSTRLVIGGHFMFYVYNKKSPIREFSDDYVREKIAPLTDREAWKALEPLTKLGKLLGELNLELNISDPVDILGIPAGKINLQRLFYWHVFKAYYRPEFSLEEMNHINFDWYRPVNCHRQTPQQVKNWVESCGLDILNMDIQEAGMTVIAKKK
jgi:SAM-dependent methyltransferase